MNFAKKAVVAASVMVAVQARSAEEVTTSISTADTYENAAEYLDLDKANHSPVHDFDMAELILGGTKIKGLEVLDDLDIDEQNSSAVQIYEDQSMPTHYVFFSDQVKSAFIGYVDSKSAEAKWIKVAKELGVAKVERETRPDHFRIKFTSPNVTAPVLENISFTDFKQFVDSVTTKDSNDLVINQKNFEELLAKSKEESKVFQSMIQI